MIASLGMYDRAETQAANDRLWALIRDALRDLGLSAPDALTRGDAAFWPAWSAPDLVLSQTCGYPFRAFLADKVTLIGTPDFGLPDCPPGYYHSVFVARTDDPRRSVAEFCDALFAYNEPVSQSGWAAPQTHAQSLGFLFRPSLQTGSHRESALAVAKGQADIAALDAVTFALCQRHDPFMSSLQVIGRTAPTPALPYIAAKGVDPEPRFLALKAAIAALAPDDRQTLMLRGVEKIDKQTYLAVPTPPSPDQIAHMR